MSFRIDHLVILVADLAQASADFADLGFTVVPGGTHTDGATHNALISFADGTYLELIAFLREAPEHRWWRYAATGEGLIDWAMLPAEIAADIAAARERGVAYDGPIPGGRQRPDGQEIAWQIGLPPAPDLPFLCADVTPRALRVPGGAATQHANGAVGIARLALAAADVRASAARYAALLGQDASPAAEPCFALGDASLCLASGGRAAARLAARGEGPYALVLRTQRGAPQRDRHHGLLFSFE